MKKVLLLLSLTFTSLVIAGDPELGKAKSATCVACHGTDGNSINPIWPNIAGQHEQYIARQLELFKSGERESSVMLGMVAGLSSEDMHNLGAYYASQKIKIGSANEDLVELGKSVYQGGVTKMNIPACMACHGVAGKGNPLSGYPVLAGQNAAYTESMLKDFRSGTTNGKEGDTNGMIMSEVAKYLTDDEIKALSSYIQGLYSK
jgi:cytochrome c553